MKYNSKLKQIFKSFKNFIKQAFGFFDISLLQKNL